ncbi:MAG: polyamine aminopropyltransferase [Chitinophagales bacterium]
MTFWLKETHTDGYYVGWKVENELWHEKTAFQELAIVETTEFGRALVLDGAIQTTEKDEFIYHEMISHVPMRVHPCPRKVLIIGGGDGGVLREVLKYSSVEHVDLVEIDRRVVEICREYLPSIAAGYNDPRAHVHYEDGIKYVKNASDQYDVAIIDSSDPIGPAVELFNKPFYQDVFRVLADDGLMVSQAESPLFYTGSFQAVHRNMKQVFPVSAPYLTCVPTYVSGFWAFVVGSRRFDPRVPGGDKPRIDGLKYYTEEIHRSAFIIPPFIQSLLD